MLVCSDARVALRDMADQSVDLVVTDPPYRTISGGNTQGKHQRPSGMLTNNDGRIFRHNDITFDEWLPDVFRVLRDPGHCYVMTNLLNLWDLHRVAVSCGFLAHNLLVWKKNTPTPNRWYMKNAEYILFLRRGKARGIVHPGSMTVHDVPGVRGDRSHPTEKPVDLMRLYIENSSNPGDIVLDPFMGSGSTGVAAHTTGRRFIGIESDREYYLTACKRLGIMPCVEPTTTNLTQMPQLG